MKTPLMVCAGIVLFLAAAVMPLAAQSLLDNQYYHKAQEQLTQSQNALDQGDYDGSADLAAQARDNLAKSDEYVATMTQFYRANGYLGMAKDRVAYAKSIDADVHYKSAYDTAVNDVAGARTALDGKDYPKSIDLSKAAIAALSSVAPVAKTPEKPPAAKPSLPQYYTVRLQLPLRDCFWRIAAFPWVYNDPWKWRLLYDANKDVLQNPKNPDLIEPGMKFIIPPLANEVREGEYDPQVQYPTVGE
jgi:nucleoid-associated protein YgaU